METKQGLEYGLRYYTTISVMHMDLLLHLYKNRDIAMKAEQKAWDV